MQQSCITFTHTHTYTSTYILTTLARLLYTHYYYY